MRDTGPLSRRLCLTPCLPLTRECILDRALWDAKILPRRLAFGHPFQSLLNVEHIRVLVGGWASVIQGACLLVATRSRSSVDHSAPYICMYLYKPDNVNVNVQCTGTCTVHVSVGILLYSTSKKLSEITFSESHILPSSPDLRPV